MNRRNGSWAPDGQHTAFYDMTSTGRWIAYVSDESGRDEVYVRPYPGPGGKQLVSTESGTEPQWSRDGRELFYRQDSQLMAVPVSAGPAFDAGTPHALFEGYETDQNGITNCGVSPDGERFLMVQAEARGLAKIIVVQNWIEELKRRVPTE